MFYVDSIVFLARRRGLGWRPNPLTYVVTIYDDAKAFAFKSCLSAPAQVASNPTLKVWVSLYLCYT